MKNQTFKVITLCFALALLPACTRSTPPANVEYDHSLSPYHIVKRGDSLSSIARNHRMDKMELIRLNGLQSPYYVVIGQRLLVRPLAATAKIRQSMPDSADMPAMEPVDQGGVLVSRLAPLTGADDVAIEPSPADVTISEGENHEEVSSSYVDQQDLQPSEPTDEDEKTTVDEKRSASAPSIPSADRTYRMPLQGRIVRKFKAGKNGNDGINISAPERTPVVASNNGVVAYAGNQLRGFGNVILIKHDNGIMSVYAHLNEISIKKDEVIKAGQKIGTVGKTGAVKEPQLHFEIRKGTTPVDPYKYLG